MKHEQFIEKNLQAELIKLDFSSSIARMASNRAKKYYRCLASASRKGKLFDDCLNLAKAWASKH
ncbi:hypothetical protein ID852_20530 [Xenorhabdus sp. 42]|uniref:Uncharacterized protein n=1 Tax=Xenorhabdus szentirmaii TaxID=290112 RepID=A0AAW3YQK2_9GAMM|nr:MULTISPECIES: hypothetical protein [unclassified Xenorhabdus]MBD2794530.1 hypothetical protein [Xenorhabdus sp. CUL]MBD2800317.1 hypothetical protein [Xenorhabdus sp. M]MBD2807198.1 hypothetical protein [Xenorhabdus sp. ZM]MBD2822995.1 hypothetical protein [Xenorhabdus sp. 42]MBD2827174.1 hypothetical protein [Xenorhabdus sp. 5]